MEVKFGIGQTAVEVPVTAPAVATQLPAVAPELPPARSSLFVNDTLPDFSDIVLPRINVVANTGKLKDIFPPGSLVLGQQVLLFSPPDIDLATGNVRRPPVPPVTMTVLGFRPTRYVEKIEYAAGARGTIVDTEAEVRANGGTLDYKEWQLKIKSGMRYYRPYADALVLIERPASSADDGTVFVWAADGRKYALALWGMIGSSYTAAAKRVFFTQRRTGCLREGGYPSFKYSVSTRLEPYATGNSAWIPVCIASGPNSPAFLGLVADILGTPQKVTSAPAEAAGQAETHE